MDVLADALTLAGVHSVLGDRIEGGEDWGWWAEERDGAAIHAVTSGTVWLAVGGRDPLQLMPGDLVLLPRGTEHALGSDAARVARTGPGTSSGCEQRPGGGVRIGSGPTRSHILCAHYERDRAVSTQLFSLLPDLVHLRAEHKGDGLDDTLRLLARELSGREVASAMVLKSLIDILLVQLLRVWLAESPEAAAPSWLSGLRDPVVAAGMGKLHADPGRDWTTASLARELAVSRATLSRRFAAVLGETPGAYLTRWRMDLAARRLREGGDSLEAIARSVGYTSVHAFSRAFSRARGEPPGRYRALARIS